MEYLSHLFRSRSRDSSLSIKSRERSPETDLNALTEFKDFAMLPPEIRIQIWMAALGDIAHDRVTVLRDPVTRYGSSRNRVINRRNYTDLFRPWPVQQIDDRQRLLQINSESRSLYLPIFTGAFGVPAPTYHFVNPREDKFSRWVVQNEPQFRNHMSNNVTARWLEGSLQHFNENPEHAARFRKQLKLGGPIKLSPPLWFNVDEDFLLIPFSRDHRPHRQSDPEWNHCGTLHAGKVKKLAIEMSRSDWDHQSNFGHAVFPRAVWSTSLATGRVEWEKLQKVEEIAIWSREGCEICWFSHDTEGTLKPGEWSFRLDTADNQFKERFGERWSNITWHIKVGGSTVTNADGTMREKNICEMLRDWKPHASDWWACKLMITEKVPKGVLGDAWLKLRNGSPRPWNMMPEGMTKVKGAVEGTYLGLSFNPREEAW